MGGLEGRRIFITGGAGFIGSRLVERLHAANSVVVYDNFRRRSLSEALENHKNVELIRGDVLDTDALTTAMRDAEVIIHCAAIAGIDSVIQKPVETLRVNLLGTANVLEAASDSSAVTRVVCFSTSEVFGSRAFRSDEADSTVIGHVGEARWTYAVGKLAAEHLAIAYHQERNLPTTVIRPFNIYGPGQVGEGALKTFVRRALAGEPIEVHGDGTQIRAWCYVDDAVDAILQCCTVPAAVGESFNIGNQRAVVTIYGLANTVVRVLGSESEIRFTRKDYADVELRIPSVRKAQELLGFEARIDLEEGIRRTAEYYGAT